MADYDYRDGNRSHRHKRKAPSPESSRRDRNYSSRSYGRDRGGDRDRDREYSKRSRSQRDKVEDEFLNTSFRELKRSAEVYIPKGISSDLIPWLKEKEHRWILELSFLEKEKQKLDSRTAERILELILKSTPWDDSRRSRSGQDRDWNDLVYDSQKRLRSALDLRSTSKIVFVANEVLEELLGYIAFKYHMVEHSLSNEEELSTNEFRATVERLRSENFSQAVQDVLDDIGKENLFSCVSLQLSREGAKWPKESPTPYSRENVLYALAFFKGAVKFAKSIGIIGPEERNGRREKDALNKVPDIRTPTSHRVPFSSFSESLDGKVMETLGRIFKPSSLEKGSKLNQKGSFLKYFSLDELYPTDSGGNEIREKEIPILSSEFRQSKKDPWWGVETCELEPLANSDDDVPMKERRVVA